MNRPDRSIRCGLIVYDHPTPKTQHVMERLLIPGPNEDYRFSVIAIPWKDKPPRPSLIQHRPPESSPNEHPEGLAQRYGIPFRRELPDRFGGEDVYLILGAGIIPVMGRKILNSHPGLTPAVRGLDAFKWAIYNDLPLGITLHEIDDEVDAGRTVAQCVTHVYAQDCMAEVARRHYWNEITVLANFDYHLRNPRWSEDVEPLPSLPPNRRMKCDMEFDTISRFPVWLKRHAESSPAYCP